MVRSKKICTANVIKPMQAVNKKPIIASPEENERNSRARSAKLRIAIRVEDE